MRTYTQLHLYFTYILYQWDSIEAVSSYPGMLLILQYLLLRKKYCNALQRSVVYWWYGRAAMAELTTRRTKSINKTANEIWGYWAVITWTAYNSYMRHYTRLYLSRKTENWNVICRSFLKNLSLPSPPPWNSLFPFFIWRTKNRQH